MNKINILREISLIHAVKCKKTESDAIALNSFNTLNEFKKHIELSHDFQQLNEKISLWKSQEPSVSDYDIISLLKND